MQDHDFDKGDQRDVKQLIEQCEEMLQSNKPYFFEQSNFEQIIDFYEDRNELNKALEVADIAFSQHPYSAVMLTKKAQLLFDLKKFEEAIALLDKASVLDSSDLTIWLQYADIYTAMGKYGDALDQLNKALELVDDNELDDLYLEFADLYEESANYNGALKYIVKALEINPKHEEALSRINFVCDIAENYDQSIKLHQKIIDKVPYSGQAWYNLGYAYFQLKLYEKAISALDYALVINEDDIVAYRLLGDANYKLKQYQQALDAYLAAIRLGKSNKSLFYKIGRCFEHTGDMIKARYHYRKALTINPNYEKALYRMGVSYAKEKRWTSASEYLERVCKVKEGRLLYWRALGNARFQMADYNNAIQVWDKVLALNGKNKADWISLAACYAGAEEFESASSILTEAQKQLGANAELNYYKSAFLYAYGNRKNAALELEAGLALDYQKHTLLYEAFPELEKDSGISGIIAQFKE